MNPMLPLDQQALERQSLDRNEVLFRQGDKVTAIYFVEVGRLRLERRTFDGRLLVLGTAPAGEFFVEAALFAEIFSLRRGGDGTLSRAHLPEARSAESPG